ncbi:hypothetical protein OF829_00320 [Sphingomonas sp. LB-2]|uniref:hypothetical protein n=1 Tax=Sphingomonas caeni TaxID=2984949 RepID=UPI002230F814|nr:hypothetical protein [Sphingomonas caeni]MCW3845666.1 hypothetical protein [Sphingomonas caeni]
MKLIAIAAASFVAFAATPAMAQTVAPTPPDEVQTVDDPKGGYQPTQPLFSAPPQPGQTVIFVPSTRTPTEAYPPPPPQRSYPICKRNQFDNCRQRGG